MTPVKQSLSWLTLVVVAVVSVVVASCSPSAPSVVEAPPPPVDVPTPALRVVNVGTASITGLKIGFPRETVAFGDLASGATSSYRTVQAVYPYGALEGVTGGQLYRQTVIDYIDQLPMVGEVFTYRVEAPPGSTGLLRVVRVTRDR